MSLKRLQHQLLLFVPCVANYYPPVSKVVPSVDNLSNSTNTMYCKQPQCIPEPKIFPNNIEYIEENVAKHTVREKDRWVEKTVKAIINNRIAIETNITLKKMNTDEFGTIGRTTAVHFYKNKDCQLAYERYFCWVRFNSRFCSISLKSLLCQIFHYFQFVKIQ